MLIYMTLLYYSPKNYWLKVGKSMTSININCKKN